MVRKGMRNEISIERISKGICREILISIINELLILIEIVVTSISAHQKPLKLIGTALLQ